MSRVALGSGEWVDLYENDGELQLDVWDSDDDNAVVAMDLPKAKEVIAMFQEKVKALEEAAKHGSCKVGDLNRGDIFSTKQTEGPWVLGSSGAATSLHDGSVSNFMPTTPVIRLRKSDVINVARDRPKPPTKTKGLTDEEAKAAALDGKVIRAEVARAMEFKRDGTGWLGRAAEYSQPWSVNLPVWGGTHTWSIVDEVTT